MNHALFVAPREVHDLTYRCGRVAGCDAGSAQLLARAVTFAEIHDHRAIDAFFDVQDNGSIETVVAAYSQIGLGEVEARAGREVTLTFDPPIPEALTALARFEAATRGAETVDLALTEGWLSTIVLGPGEVSDSLTRAHGERLGRAHLEGLAISRSRFDALTERARAFQVSEASLDALVDQAVADL